MTKKPEDGSERRKAKRRPIISSFSLFVVVPKKGIHRLVVNDVSDEGMGFEIDTEGESPEDFPIAKGNVLDVQFFLNQSLYLPLTVEVVRLINQEGGVRKVGTIFTDKSSQGYKAYASFVQMLDQIADAAQLQSQ